MHLSRQANDESKNIYQITPINNTPLQFLPPHLFVIFINTTAQDPMQRTADAPWMALYNLCFCESSSFVFLVYTQARQRGRRGVSGVLFYLAYKALLIVLLCRFCPIHELSYLAPVVVVFALWISYSFVLIICDDHIYWLRSTNSLPLLSSFTTLSVLLLWRILFWACLFYVAIVRVYGWWTMDPGQDTMVLNVIKWIKPTRNWNPDEKIEKPQNVGFSINLICSLDPADPDPALFSFFLFLLLIDCLLAFCWLALFYLLVLHACYFFFSFAPGKLPSRTR